jgi:hypothetical protein
MCKEKIGLHFKDWASMDFCVHNVARRSCIEKNGNKILRNRKNISHSQNNRVEIAYELL